MDISVGNGVRMIDGHIHIGRWSERFFGLEVGLDRTDEVLGSCGFEGAVVTATDLRDNELVLREIERARLRYWFFAWVNPADKGGLQRLEEWGSRVSGLKFHPSCDEIRITDQRCEPFLEYAEERNLPVLVHCGRWQEMASYRYALEAARKHPGVRFVFAHMGGDQPDLVKATCQALSSGNLRNVWLGMEGIREYWLIRRVIDDLGAERVIFGSDYPIGHPKMYLGVIDALDLAENERRWICRETVLSVISG
ncbi:MAG: amidohydrolase family protein [Candidatus Eisenbacteria sp.]|nr:amidohydrolase family protein [Candidatus Eisenbacteria bacterium]